MGKFNIGNTKASRMTPQSVIDMREDYASGEYSQAMLSRKYKVSIGTVYNIVHGLTWQNLPPVVPAEQLAFEAKQSIKRLDIAEPVDLDPKLVAKLNRDLTAGPEVEDTLGLPTEDEVFNRRAARAALKEDSDESVEKTDESKGQGQGDTLGTLERGSEDRLAPVQGAESSADRPVIPGEEAEGAEV